MATSIYHPLQEERLETRFIQIETAQIKTDAVSCTLHTKSLDDCEPYHALSYVWGSRTDTTRILLNGDTYMVTANLETALQQLRASGHIDMPIWIDALCINQTDISEKSVQIGLMGRIYGNARLVIGWLGPRSETSDLGMDTIHLWRKQSQSLLSRGDDDVSDILQRISEDESLLSGEITEAIVQLFERAWWYRQWISQEIILANDVLISCGDKSIHWSDLCEVNRAWRSLMQPMYAEVFHTSQQLWLGALASDVFELFDSLRGRRSSHQHPPLDSLLPTFRGFRGSDPRDKVYALLGFASDGLSVTPDYRLTTKDLYTRYMVARLEATDDLDDLQHCFFDEKSAQQGIPSWVPDWSNSNTPTSIDYQSYNCAGTEKPTLSVSRDSNVLRIHGVRITKIARSFPAEALLPPLSPEEEVKSAVWKSFIPIQNDPQKNSKVKDTWGVRLFRTAYMDIDPTTSERFDRKSTSFFGLLFANCWWLRHYHSVPDNVILKTWFGQQDTLKNRDDLNMMTKKWLKEYEPHILQGFQTANRRFFVAEDDDMGLCPSSIGEGDDGEYYVCIFLGCRVPFVLHKFERGYRIIGECFMLGIMDGEAIERMVDGEFVSETFDIY